MANADYVYIAELDDSQILRAFQRIEKRADQLEKRLNTVFQNIGKFDITRLNDSSRAFAELGKNAQTGSKNIQELQKKVDALNESLKNLTKDVAIKATIEENNVVSTSQQASASITPRTFSELQPQNEVSSTTPSPPINEEEMAKNLFAQQLKLQEGLSATEKRFIRQSGAVAEYVDELEALVSANTNLTNSQIQTSKQIAIITAKIASLKQNLDESETEYDQNSQAVAQYEEQLKGLKLTLLQENLQIAKNKQAEAGAKRVLLANIRNVKKVRGELSKYINTQGQVVVKIGATNAELSEEERKTLSVIRANKQLSNVLDKLAEKYGKVSVGIDNKDLPTTDKKGGILGFFTDLAGKISLKTMLINLATSAIKNFVSTAKTGLTTTIRLTSETATQFEILEGVIKTAFQITEPDQINFALDKIRQVSEAVGTNVSSLAATFAGQISSFEELQQLGEVSQLLLFQSQITGKPATQSEIVRTLGELQSGFGRTFYQIFEIPPEDANRVAKAFTESIEKGYEAALDLFEKRGLNVDEFLNSLPILQNRFSQVLRTIAGEIGEPINEGLRQLFSGAIEFFNENRGDLLQLANQLGELIGGIISLGGDKISEFLANLDVKGLVQLISDFVVFTKELKNTGEALAPVFEVMKKTLQLILPGVAGFTQLGDSIKNIEFEQLTKKLLDFQAGIERIKLFGEFLKGTIFEPLKETVSELFQEFVAFLKETLNLQPFLDKIKEFFENFSQGLDKLKNANLFEEGIKEFQLGLIRLTEKLKDLLIVIKQIAETQTIFPNVDTSKIDLAIGKLNEFTDNWRRNIEEQDEVIQEILNRPTSGVVDDVTQQNLSIDFPQRVQELNENEQEIIKKRLEIERDYTDKLIENEIENQRKRVELAEKLSNKLVEIERKRLQDIEDANKKYERDVADLAEDFKDKEADLAQESADKRLEIEKEYLRKLEELRRKFQFDAEEAIRKNDAIRFLQLKRQLEFDKREARIKRDQDLEDLKDTEQKKRDELNKQLEKQRKDLQKELQRRLEDIALNAKRQREEAILAYKEDVKAQLEAEQQKREDLLRSYEQQLEDFRLFQEEKIGTFESYLEEQLSIIDSKNKELDELQAKSQEQILAQYAQIQEQYKRELDELGIPEEERLNLLNEVLLTELTTIQNSNAQILGTEQTSYAARLRALQSFVTQFEKQLKSLSRYDALLSRYSLRTGTNESPASSGLTQKDRLIINAQKLYSRINDLSKVPSYIKNSMGQINSLSTEQLLSLIKALQDLTGSKIGGRRFGGPVSKNTPYIVGENGPELFAPSFSGTIIPLMERRNFSIPTVTPTGKITNNTFENIFNFSGGTNGLSGQQITMIKNMLFETLLQISKQIS